MMSRRIPHFYLFLNFYFYFSKRMEEIRDEGSVVDTASEKEDVGPSYHPLFPPPLWSSSPPSLPSPSPVGHRAAGGREGPAPGQGGEAPA